MPPLQPREVGLSIFSSIHRLVVCSLLSVNVRAAGTMATANLMAAKRERLQSITPKLCAKTQLGQIRNLREEFSACQHFCELFQNVNGSWLISNCFRQSKVVWSCFSQNDNGVFWKEYYQKPVIFFIGWEIKKKKPRIIQRDIALVLLNLILFALSIPFLVCLYYLFQANRDTKPFELHVMEVVTFYQCPPINPEFHLCSSLFSDLRYSASSQTSTSHKNQRLRLQEKKHLYFTFPRLTFFSGKNISPYILIKSEFYK